MNKYSHICRSERNCVCLFNFTIGQIWKYRSTWFQEGTPAGENVDKNGWENKSK